MRRSELQAQRMSVGLSQEALAQRVGVSTASIRGWEAGVSAPRLQYREALARHLGVSMIQLNRLIDPGAPISLNGDGLRGGSEWLSLFVRAEQMARAAWVFEAANMPGLLQCRAYSIALEHTYHRPASQDEIDARTEMRLARAAVLDRQPDPLELSVRFPWYVLRDVVGGPKVMIEQCDHLARLAERPNVDLRIIAGDRRAVSAPGTFTLLTTAGSPAPDLAAEDGLIGFRYHEEPYVVRDFVALFERITEAALSPSESVRLIKRIREDYR